MNKYKVLWFDDRHEEYEIEKDEAFQKGITLVCFENAVDGIRELELNYNLYDAIIVDGLFYKDATQKGDADNKAFGEVAKVIDNLKSKGKIIPWFIYSGQNYIVKDKDDLISFFAEKAFCNGRVFDKSEENDFIELCDEIIKAADQIEKTKLKQKYADVFKVCTDAYLGDEINTKILNILLTLENENQIVTAEDLFTPLRKILESVFVKLSYLNLLPKQIIENRGSINGSSLFLANKHSDFNHEIEFIDPLIAHTIHKLLDVIQDASHSEGSLKLKVDNYIRETRSSYLYKSCVYQLLEIICWFQRLKDNYPDLEENKKMWDAIGGIKSINEEVIEGIIEQDVNNNYYCGNYALNYNFTKDNFKIGDKIKITQWSENNDNRTKSYYSQFATRFEKIN